MIEVGVERCLSHHGAKSRNATSILRGTEPSGSLLVEEIPIPKGGGLISERNVEAHMLAMFAKPVQ